MAATRLLMRRLREILRLKYEAGLPHRAIAQACAVGLGHAHLTGLGDIEPLIHIGSINSRLGVVLARSAPGLKERITAFATQ